MTGEGEDEQRWHLDSEERTRRDGIGREGPRTQGDALGIVREITDD